MTRIIYSVACSVDGQIARSDGSVDWLDARPAADYGLEAFVASVGTIVWGRATFEQGQKLGGLAPFGKGMRHIVLSRQAPPASLEPHVEFTSAAPEEVARRLRLAAHRDVWVMGGADLAASFLAAGAVDEVVLHVMPILLGPGIPLVRALPRDVPLRLVGSHAYPDGVVRLHYAVAP